MGGNAVKRLPALLRTWSLPRPDGEGDHRGTVQRATGRCLDIDEYLSVEIQLACPSRVIIEHRQSSSGAAEMVAIDGYTGLTTQEPSARGIGIGRRRTPSNLPVFSFEAAVPERWERWRNSETGTQRRRHIADVQLRAP